MVDRGEAELGELVVLEKRGDALSSDEADVEDSVCGDRGEVGEEEVEEEGAVEGHHFEEGDGVNLAHGEFGVAAK